MLRVGLAATPEDLAALGYVKVRRARATVDSMSIVAGDSEMSQDETFLAALAALEDDVGAGDTAAVAGLLHTVLLGPEPLAHAVNRERRLRLRFPVMPIHPPPGAENWSSGPYLWPGAGARGAPEFLTLSQFLVRRTAVTFYRAVTVGELVYVVARGGDVAGAGPDVETRSRPHDRVGLPDGMGRRFTDEIAGIARITLEGLAHLREVVARDALGQTRPAFG